MAAAHALLYYIFRSGFLRNRLFRATIFRYVFSITQKRLINNETVKKLQVPFSEHDLFQIHIVL